MRKTEKNILQKPAEDMLKTMGIKYIRKQNNQYQQKYRRSSDKMFSGLPDLVIFFRHRNVVFVEFKLPTGDLSDKQIEWQEYLINHGYKYYVITDIEQFVGLVSRCR